MSGSNTEPAVAEDAQSFGTAWTSQPFLVCVWTPAPLEARLALELVLTVMVVFFLLRMPTNLELPPKRG